MTGHPMASIFPSTWCWICFRICLRIWASDGVMASEKEGIEFGSHTVDTYEKLRIWPALQGIFFGGACHETMRNGTIRQVDTRPRRSISWSHSVRSTPSKERSQRVNSDDTPVGDRSDRDNPQEAEEFTRAQTMKSKLGNVFSHTTIDDATLYKSLTSTYFQKWLTIYPIPVNRWESGWWSLISSVHAITTEANLVTDVIAGDVMYNWVCSSFHQIHPTVMSLYHLPVVPHKAVAEVSKIGNL